MSRSLSSQDIYMVHLASRLGVLVSIIWVVGVLVSAFLREYWFHVLFVVGGVMAGFVSSIASSYIVSGLRGKKHSAMPIARWVLVLSPILASLWSLQ